MKELADHLRDFDVRSYLSQESISSIRASESSTLELMIDQHAIASLVHVILRWWASHGEEITVTAADRKFVVADESGAEDLLDFVRQELERDYKPDPHGSGGSWE